MYVTLFQYFSNQIPTGETVASSCFANITQVENPHESFKRFYGSSFNNKNTNITNVEPFQENKDIPKESHCLKWKISLSLSLSLHPTLHLGLAG